MLKPLQRALTWRLRSLGRAVYSSHDILFWVAGREETAPDLDEAKLASILESLRLTARKATIEDLPLFLRYRRRCGRLGWGCRRMLLKRWANGDDCYIALDRDGEIVAQLWLAYEWYQIEGHRRRVGPDEIYYYGADTRPDRNGSMGYMACSCAAVPEFVLRRGRSKAIAWVEPRLFARFQMVSAWLGLSEPRPFRIERHTRICGLRFCRATEVCADWEYREAPMNAPVSQS